MQNKLKSVRFSCIILAHQHFLDIEYCIPEEKMLLSKSLRFWWSPHVTKKKHDTLKAF